MHVFRATVWAVWILTSVPASSSQIVLPAGKAGAKGGDKGSSETQGNLAPYLLCTVCGERSYNLRDDGRRDDKGRVIGWCTLCRRDTPMRRPDPPASAGGATGRGGRLILPATRTSTPSSTSGAQGTNRTTEAKPGATPAPKTASSAARGPSPRGSGPADFIFSEVSRMKRIDDELSQRAVENLLALGEDGIDAARRNLSSEESPALLVAARVLLRSGLPEDADRVRDRLASPLPVAAGAPLFELFASSDPVRASPAFLAELLDHPHAGVRAGAQKRLASLARSEGSDVDLLSLLERPLASRRAETRRRALDLVAGLDGSAATQVLLARVADPSAAVAASVASALAIREDPDVDARLLALAFRDRWILRPGACALLAAVEREDRTVRPLLDETHVEPLLAGLSSSDVFVSGACASALAGIGFRMHGNTPSAWLDRDVVDRLVASISGQKFHSDLPALTGPALRRLELVTGAGLGGDGPRWVEWWLKARDGFVARRAWFEVSPEEVPAIRVTSLRRGAKAASPAEPASPASIALLGPAAEADPEFAGYAVRLTEAQARDLVSALEREGLFSHEHLPGLRGLRGEGERTLEIALDAGGRARSKSFTFGPGRTEPWFDRAEALALELLDRNRWQRFPDPARHETARALWEEQVAWWAEPHSDRERALRMKSLVLAALPATVRTGAPERVTEAVAELERLYREPGTAEPADFPFLVQALGAERFWSKEAERLLDLALLSARSRPAVAAADGAPSASAAPVDASPTDAAAPAADAGAPAAVDLDASPAPSPDSTPTIAPAGERDVPLEQGHRLVDLLVEKFPSAAPDELPRVFAACPLELANSLAEDLRPGVRVAAARALAKGPTPADADTVAKLLRLLGDRDPAVEAAAAEALGARGVESARTELLVRARLGAPEVRAAALHAVGRLKGDFVLDALSLAAADPDPKIRVAAAEGLAALGDPAATPLLIEMLGEGESTPTADAARVGLLALGPRAWEQLLRVMNSSTHRARREATLLLSRQGVPEAAPAILALLSASPKDAHLSSELAVLSGADLRAEPDPTQAWWSWWDGVVHDDSLTWFLSALARAGEQPPPRADFDGAGTRDARLFLVEVLARKEAHFVERARRELARMLERDVGAAPPRGAARDQWIAGWREAVLASTDK